MFSLKVCNNDATTSSGDSMLLAFASVTVQAVLDPTAFVVSFVASTTLSATQAGTSSQSIVGFGLSLMFAALF